MGSKSTLQNLILLPDQYCRIRKMSERNRPYDRHTDGPLQLQPQKSNRRTVTIPDRVGPHVKLVFAEMARQRRHYDAVAEASGVRRASLKAWRRKNRPGLESLEAVLNALGWRLISTPAIEVMPPQFGAEIARLAAAAQVTVPDGSAAMTLLSAGQLAASENGFDILAELQSKRLAGMRKSPVSQHVATKH